MAYVGFRRRRRVLVSVVLFLMVLFLVVLAVVVMVVAFLVAFLVVLRSFAVLLRVAGVRGCGGG